MTDKIQYRTIILDTRKADSDKRTVPATLSSEQPVERAFGMEVLSHDKGAVDLSRAVNGLPLLFCHNADEPIGRAENIRISGRKLKADLRFSKSARGSEIWQDVADGVLTDISIGYRIDDFEETAETLTATRWTIFETSVVTISADTAAGINRSLKMDKDKTTEPGDDSNVVPHQRWLKQEKHRRDNVRAVFSPFADDYADLLNRCMDDPQCTVEQASQRLLRAVGDATGDPVGGDFRQSSNGGSLSQRDMQDVGRRAYGDFTAKDTLSEFADAATDAILMRGGVRVENPHPAAADCSRMRMSDVAETILRQFGDRTSGMSRDQIIRKALSTRGFVSHSSSDFPNLLENVASKALLQGFFEVPAIYRKIAKVGTLPDFKPGSRTALSDFSDLEVVYENGEYKYGSFSDLKETLTLQTFGKLFSISRQCLVNDDLSAFTQIPRGLAAASVRVIDDMVVNVLIDNAALNQDSTALFHADHSNLQTSGAAPSVTTLDAGFVSMASQTGPGPDGAILDVKPSLLIVPASLDATARTLVTAINDPSGTTLAEPNPFRGRLEVVSTARLDVDSTVKWYLSANPNVFDSIEVAFLDGQTSPYLETKDGWNVDGVEYKVRLDCVAGAMDFRGLYMNDGD